MRLFAGVESHVCLHAGVLRETLGAKVGINLKLKHKILIRVYIEFAEVRIIGS